MNEKWLSESATGTIPAYRGTLKELLVGEERASELKQEIIHLASWDLSLRQVCDIELLLNGGFSPLEGFMDADDYESVCREMRLKDGTLWPLPITLDVTEEFAASISKDARIALRHPEGMALAVLTVSDVWRPDFAEEARLVYGTTDEFHPGVFSLFHQTNPIYIGGTLEGLELPPQHTFSQLRHTPATLRGLFDEQGWNRVVAFQTRNPMHRAHVELTYRATAEADTNLLIHPVVGLTRPGDVDYFVRVRCYEAVLKHYPERSAMLSLLPLAMRMAGPREALWHAIIRQNYGCTHFILGRDHAGPGTDSQGNPFYPPYAAQELLREHQGELGIEMMPFEEMVYVEDVGKYMSRSDASHGATVRSLSGTELRSLLRDGSQVPEWFSYPEVIAELRGSLRA